MITAIVFIICGYVIFRSFKIIHGQGRAVVRIAAVIALLLSVFIILGLLLPQPYYYDRRAITAFEHRPVGKGE